MTAWSCDEFSGPLLTNRSMRVHVDPVAGREIRSVTGSDPTWWRSKRVLDEPRPRYGTVGEEDLVEHQKAHGEDRGRGRSECDAWCLA